MQEGAGGPNQGAEKRPKRSGARQCDARSRAQSVLHGRLGLSFSGSSAGGSRAQSRGGRRANGFERTRRRVHASLSPQLFELSFFPGGGGASCRRCRHANRAASAPRPCSRRAARRAAAQGAARTNRVHRDKKRRQEWRSHSHAGPVGQGVRANARCQRQSLDPLWISPPRPWGQAGRARGCEWSGIFGASFFCGCGQAGGAGRYISVAARRGAAAGAPCAPRPRRLGRAALLPAARRSGARGALIVALFQGAHAASPAAAPRKRGRGRLVRRAAPQQPAASALAEGWWVVQHARGVAVLPKCARVSG
ncbi:MAG: hypothetical protein J3K34DRAFT_409635 [Monoraphidium minutum]|nr:MAG: hypothetical protein J3K34DRAFT_409635 [Monoraphidium minutum]